jgi:type I restriction enzyme S subunit
MSEGLNLPRGWCCTAIGAITAESMNGFGRRRSDQGEPIIVLRLADIEDGDITLASTRRICATTDEIKKYALICNDLLMIRVNGSADLVGRVVQFKDASEPDESDCPGR